MNDLKDVVWEEFTDKRMLRNSSGAVTIRKTGQISFNKTTVEKYVKQNSHVSFYLSIKPEQIIMAFHFHTQPEKGSYRVTWINKYSASCSGISVLKKYDLIKPKSQGYIIEPTTISGKKMPSIKINIQTLKQDVR
jgi:hypothetical protein